MLRNFGRMAWQLSVFLVVVRVCLAVVNVSRADELSAAPRFATSPALVLKGLPALVELVRGDDARPAAMTPEVVDFLTHCCQAETLSDDELIDAFLVASGEYGTTSRGEYAEQIARLVADAREMIKSDDSRGRADELLRYLHAGPMKAGYSAEQSSLSAVLESSQYNCVSATALYQLVGRRLGLDLRAMEIPGGLFVDGHALSILHVDGQTIDVETTNAEGFDPGSKPEFHGGIAGPKPDRDKAREVEDRTLAALIALNRAGVATQEGRFHEAVEAGLVAMCLAPREAATQNLVAALNGWSESLIEAGDPAGAVAVFRYGRRLDPRDEVLSHNLECSLEKLAAAELALGHDQPAVEILTAAVVELPQGDLEDAPADLFIYAADEAIDRGDWAAGIEILARGVRVLAGANWRQVSERHASTYGRWADALRKEKKYTAGVEALVRGGRACGSDAMEDQIGYFITDALIDLVAGGDVTQGTAILAQLRTEFPASECLIEAGDRRVYFELESLVNTGQLDKALARFDELAPLLTRAGELAVARSRVYRGCASYQREQSNWKTALAVLFDGSKACPGDEALVNDTVYTFDAWAQTFIGQQQWQRAIEVYDRGLTLMPDQRDLKDNREYCQRRLQEQ